MALFDNIKAYYKLDELSGNAADSTGNGYTLTNNNTVAFITPGKQSGCADFGTANTNKSLSTTNGMGVDGTAITYSLWVKMRTEIGSGVQDFVGHGDITVKSDSFIEYDYNGGTRQIHFTRARPGVGADSVTTNITLGTTNWYHLAMTWDGSTITGYVNGASVGTIGSTTQGSVATATGFGIGFRNAAASGYASAYIDEVGFWSRALSSGEISSLYGGGRGAQYPNGAPFAGAGSFLGLF